ncbi:glycoside hydrolase family 15 protein [Paenibacillus sp. GD4]|uniref:glycoside hydrolase family 15 protein n=1 Tax=Paenibacillus sp. GD4 TaxID=3068890 RepID=UPI002796CF3B|nr:glycoside hydrolase family 15 protein [Paenibacillus sp. GD4]MDQ1912952.1 glycoside hydrolase family 15 protein [Paenibacillus sp. GD4]
MFTKGSLEDLAQVSRQLISWNQHPSGGYVASPLFHHYGFSWLRDGTFIAYAMDTTGEHESARRFYDWINRIIARKTNQIDDLIAKHQRGENIPQDEFLHTRYHLDGSDDTDSEWGHFQLDGYGAWLWGVTEHWRRNGVTEIPESFRVSIDSTIQYLSAFWNYPNFDCWEEFSDKLHPATLACIFGGLRSIASFAGRSELFGICDKIQDFILKHAMHPDGYIVKYITPVYEISEAVRYELGTAEVDASLMWLCEPFEVLPIDHPAMRKTFAKLTADLRTIRGGIRRYVTDTYYGGGEWLLLTAWYGLLQLRSGNTEEARESLAWIGEQADSLGRLPEQVPDALQDFQGYEEWVRRWGTPALPLLWSHAMYLVLYNKLREVEISNSPF